MHRRQELRRSVRWTADRTGDISSSSQAFAEIVDAEMGFDATASRSRWKPTSLATSGLFDLSVDVGPRDRAGRQLPARFLQIQSYRGAARASPPASRRPDLIAELAARFRPLSPSGSWTWALARSASIRWKYGAAIRARDEFPYCIASGSSGTELAFLNASRPRLKPPTMKSYVELRQVARAEGRYVGIGIAG